MIVVEQHYSIFESTPTTFLVLSDCQDNEYHSFIRRFKELATGSSTKEKLPHKHCAQNVWLVKPAALNQGNLTLSFISIYPLLNRKGN
jgi:hypothetical protein